MITRCKFFCESVTKSRHWKQASGGVECYLYRAKFFAVHENSPENKAFFEATPSGSLEIGSYKEDRFQVGKEYYIDILLAPETIQV